jgi:hypothetical protein
VVWDLLRAVACTRGLGFGFFKASHKFEKTNLFIWLGNSKLSFTHTPH